jgi:hypothetical protein
MTHNEILPEKYSRLRRQAEERVRQWPCLASCEQTDLHKVIHELKIHLAELEIQNEELRRTMKEMVERQDNDEKMYDFSPLKEKTEKYNGDYRRIRAHRDATQQARMRGNR